VKFLLSASAVAVLLGGAAFAIGQANSDDGPSASAELTRVEPLGSTPVTITRVRSRVSISDYPPPPEPVVTASSDVTINSSNGADPGSYVDPGNQAPVTPVTPVSQGNPGGPSPAGGGSWTSGGESISTP